MDRRKFMFFTSAGIALFAAPTLALAVTQSENEWVEVGRKTLSPQVDQAMFYLKQDQPLPKAFKFSAVGNSVWVESVAAHFGRGSVPEVQSVKLSLPPGFTSPEFQFDRKPKTLLVNLVLHPLNNVATELVLLRKH